jgi:hypothetical protein
VNLFYLASLNSARAKSRDARRIADLKQMQTALELYYDSSGQYPQPAQGWNTWSGHCPVYGNNDNYIIGLAPTYIPARASTPKIRQQSMLCPTDNCGVYPGSKKLVNFSNFNIPQLKNNPDLASGLFFLSSEKILFYRLF